MRFDKQECATNLHAHLRRNSTTHAGYGTPKLGYSSIGIKGILKPPQTLIYAYGEELNARLNGMPKIGVKVSTHA